MLRAVLLLTVLAACIPLTMPPAVAECEIVDPTGTTTTCVGDWVHETGDPTCTANGYHYGSTWIWTGVYAVAHVSAAGESWCNDSNGWHHEGKAIRAGVSAYPVSIGFRYLEYSENTASHCVMVVTVWTPAAVVEFPKECKGGLPDIPWGDLLPG